MDILLDLSVSDVVSHPQVLLAVFDVGSEILVVNLMVGNEVVRRSSGSSCESERHFADLSLEVVKINSLENFVNEWLVDRGLVDSRVLDLSVGGLRLSEVERVSLEGAVCWTLGESHLRDSGWQVLGSVGRGHRGLDVVVVLHSALLERVPRVLDFVRVESWRRSFEMKIFRRLYWCLAAHQHLRAWHLWLLGLGLWLNLLWFWLLG